MTFANRLRDTNYTALTDEEKMEAEWALIDEALAAGKTVRLTSGERVISHKRGWTVTEESQPQGIVTLGCLGMEIDEA